MGSVTGSASVPANGLRKAASDLPHRSPGFATAVRCAKITGPEAEVALRRHHKSATLTVNQKLRLSR